MTEQLHFHFSLLCIGERNGNPLQCSCLENARDGRAWWAAISGVTQSRTWLKRFGSNITADGDCSHEIKGCLLLGRKAVTNVNSILKTRDLTLPTKIRIVKAMVFPVVMYGCENWTIKKSWMLKNWCLQTVVLEKTLESPLDCKEIHPVHPNGNLSEY